ncbi:hypothetical protein B0H10DRAFT_1944829 [Mycena sp. CBHHK59/15]|nr:hypothetical protein B0H10DRAFT_1944829 [Mycena sp. CBHHK59/15]
MAKLNAATSAHCPLTVPYYDQPPHWSNTAPSVVRKYLVTSVTPVRAVVDEGGRGRDEQERRKRAGDDVERSLMWMPKKAENQSRPCHKGLILPGAAHSLTRPLGHFTASALICAFTLQIQGIEVGIVTAPSNYSIRDGPVMWLVQDSQGTVHARSRTEFGHVYA